LPAAILALIQGIIAGAPAAIQLGTQIAELVRRQQAGESLTQADADAAVAGMDASGIAWDNRPGPHA
jgi:hypothetical protein